MTRHIILWKLKSMPEAEKKAVMQGIKEGLEGLMGKIPGLLSVQVLTEGLPSSTADLMLNTAFSAPEDLLVYRDHPAHVAVADAKVRPYTETRVAFDYTE